MLFRFRFERVRRGLVLKCGVVGLTELGVRIQGDLAVQRENPAVVGQDERVDLDQGGVFRREHAIQLHENWSDLVNEFSGELRGYSDFFRLREGDALVGVDLDTGKCVGAFDRQLLDVHAAFVGTEAKVRAVCAVEQNGEVILLRDRSTFGDHDALDDVTLDVETEDCLRRLERVVGGLGDFDATRLAAAAGLDLRLDDRESTDCGGGRTGFFWGVGNDSLKNGNAVLFEHVTRLILVKIHCHPIDKNPEKSGLTASRPCSSLPFDTEPTDRTERVFTAW